MTFWHYVYLEYGRLLSINFVSDSLATLLSRPSIHPSPALSLSPLSCRLWSWVMSSPAHFYWLPLSLLFRCLDRCCRFCPWEGEEEREEKGGGENLALTLPQWDSLKDTDSTYGMWWLFTRSKGQPYSLVIIFIVAPWSSSEAVVTLFNRHCIGMVIIT